MRTVFRLRRGGVGSERELELDVWQGCMGDRHECEHTLVTLVVQ